MKYKVYEVEDKMTQSGKALKKLVLQGEGKQYPDKNVTLWNNHPLFEEIAPGQTIDVEIDVQDSTTPNPHGGFYKNKTVKQSGDIKKEDHGPAAQNPATQEIKNILKLKVLPELKQLTREIMTISAKVFPLTKEDMPDDFQMPDF